MRGGAAEDSGQVRRREASCQGGRSLQPGGARGLKAVKRFLRIVDFLCGRAALSFPLRDRRRFILRVLLVATRLARGAATCCSLRQCSKSPCRGRRRVRCFMWSGPAIGSTTARCARLRPHFPFHAAREGAVLQKMSNSGGEINNAVLLMNENENTYVEKAISPWKVGVVAQ